MTLKLKLGIIGAFAVVFLFFVGIALAQPSLFTSSANTSSATTSPAYLGIGTATSTVRYDSQQIDGTNQTYNGNTWATDSAVLLIQFTASSTSSILTVAIECSVDGIDWYQACNPQQVATSTTSLAPVPKYTWLFASSTPGGVPFNTTNVNRDTRAITIQTPTRYTRAVFTMTGAAGAVWASILPKKEAR